MIKFATIDLRGDAKPTRFIGAYVDLVPCSDDGANAVATAIKAARQRKRIENMVKEIISYWVWAKCVFLGLCT